MVGRSDFSAGLQTINIVQVARLPGALPDVMVMIAGKIENVLLKKRLAIAWEDGLRWAGKTVLVNDA